MCPKPTKISKFHSLKNLEQKKEKFAKKFEKLQNYVERNKNFPEFKEDFTKISQDKILHAVYRSFKFFPTTFYNRNKGYINQKKKLCDENQFRELFDFLKKALEYQKNNLAWFTSAKWFDQNSEKIFAHFETKAESEKNDEKLKETSKNENEKLKVIEEPSPTSEKTKSKDKKYSCNLKFSDELTEIYRKKLSDRNKSRAFKRRFYYFVKPYSNLKLNSKKISKV